MARKYTDNKSLRKSTATRRTSHSSTSKILPGSESKWKDKNDSIVNDINDRLMNARFNGVSNKKFKHWSDAKANTHINDIDFFKTHKPDPYFNTETDFGPGHALKGVSDASQRTIYGEEFKVKQTIYGKKIVKNNVKTNR